MLNVGVIGIGNCGNQIATLAKKECDCDVYAINTSENDLATLPEGIPRLLVGDAQGTGKNRDAAKAFLKKSIMNIISDQGFSDFCASKEVLLVVSSMGGGSGSGMAPIMSDIIRSSFQNVDGSQKIVILVGVLPRISEGYTTQVNSLDYWHELNDVIDKPTYMLYDNNNYKQETSFKILQTVNQEVIEDIKVIQCKYNKSTPYDSIDEKDMKALLDTPGRIVIASLLGIKEKDLDECTIEDLLIDTLKKNAHAELQRDGVVQRTGLITNLNEKMNSGFDTHIEKVRKFVGEPTEEFLHIAVNEDKALPNSCNLILTGLSPIVDRIDKIRDRIDEINAAQEAANGEKNESDISADEIAEMNAKRGYRKNNSGANVDIKGIFDKFNA